MFHRLRTLALGLTLAGLALASPAWAGSTIPLRGKGTGQITHQVNPTPANPIGVQEYIAQGTLILLGNTTAKGVTFFTADGAFEGSWVATAANGDKLKAAYAGRFAPIPGTPNFRFEAAVVWGEGTGRLAGVSGRCNVVAIVNGLTGAFEWTQDGVWIRP